LVEGPVTKVIDGSEAVRVEGCREPYPPALSAAEVTVLNPDDKVC
jgi:hypothetical protein